MTPPIPQGFKPVPAGKFVAGDHKGEQVAAFSMKATPVTNAEYGDLATSLGNDRYILLRYDSKTKKIAFEKKGETPRQVLGYDFNKNINFDRGFVLRFGAEILLKIVDNPSAVYDLNGQIFSGPNQPVVGVSYFHAEAYCVLKSLEDGGKYKYDLPTDLQYEYVASNKGQCEFGTEACSSLKDKKGRKLAHMTTDEEQQVTTVTVDNPRYAQKLPFEIQTTGNVNRWIQFNPKFKYRYPGHPDFFEAASYGLRGGSWDNYPDFGRAIWRFSSVPEEKSNTIGFSPVVVRQGLDK